MIRWRRTRSELRLRSGPDSDDSWPPVSWWIGYLLGFWFSNSAAFTSENDKPSLQLLHLMGNIIKVLNRTPPPSRKELAAVRWWWCPAEVESGETRSPGIPVPLVVVVEPRRGPLKSVRLQQARTTRSSPDRAPWGPGRPRNGPGNPLLPTLSVGFHLPWLPGHPIWFSSHGKITSADIRHSSLSSIRGTSRSRRCRPVFLKIGRHGKILATAFTDDKRTQEWSTCQSLLLDVWRDGWLLKEEDEERAEPWEQSGVMAVAFIWSSWFFVSAVWYPKPKRQVRSSDRIELWNINTRRQDSSKAANGKTSLWSYWSWVPDYLYPALPQHGSICGREKEEQWADSYRSSPPWKTKLPLSEDSQTSQTSLWEKDIPTPCPIPRRGWFNTRPLGIRQAIGGLVAVVSMRSGCWFGRRGGPLTAWPVTSGRCRECRPMKRDPKKSCHPIPSLCESMAWMTHLPSSSNIRPPFPDSLHPQQFSNHSARCSPLPDLSVTATMACCDPWHWDWKPFSCFHSGLSGKNGLRWMLPSASFSGFVVGQTRRARVLGMGLSDSLPSVATLTANYRSCPRTARLTGFPWDGRYSNDWHETGRSCALFAVRHHGFPHGLGYTWGEKAKPGWPR